MKVKLDAVERGVVNGRNSIIVIDPDSPDPRAKNPEVEDYDVAACVAHGLAKRSDVQPARLTGVDETDSSTTAMAASGRMARFNDQVDPNAPPSGLDTARTTAFQNDPHDAGAAPELAEGEEAPASGRGRGRKAAATEDLVGDELGG